MYDLYENYSNGLYEEEYITYTPSTKLAGIDCSAFVSACLSISRRNTTGLADIALLLNNRSELKPGDFLDDVGSHVILVLEEFNGTLTDLAESVSPHVRVLRNYNFTNYSNQSRYDAYTPFPIFANILPTNNSFTDNTKPAIQVTIKSGTSISTSTVILKIDDNVVSPIFSWNGSTTVTLSYTPTLSLDEKQHIIYVEASNTLGLNDGTSSYFSIDLTSPTVTWRTPPFADSSLAPIQDYETHPDNWTNLRYPRISANLTGAVRMILTG